MTTSPATVRPTWDDTWLAVAAVMGTRSLCARAQVGCVIVDPRNRVVASGYNNPPAGFEHHGQDCLNWCDRAVQAAAGAHLGPDYRRCPALHAEANALSVGDRRDREGGTLYVTSHVCFDCAKLVANSGLVRVVVATTDPALWRLPHASYNFLRACGLAIEVRT